MATAESVSRFLWPTASDESDKPTRYRLYRQIEESRWHEEWPEHDIDEAIELIIEHSPGKEVILVGEAFGATKRFGHEVDVDAQGDHAGEPDENDMKNSHWVYSRLG